MRRKKRWKGRLKFTDKRGWLWGDVEQKRRPAGTKVEKVAFIPAAIFPVKYERERRKGLEGKEGGGGVGVLKGRLDIPWREKERERKGSSKSSFHFSSSGRSWRRVKKRHPFPLSLSLSRKKKRRRKEGVDSVCQAKTGATEDSCQPFNYSANSIERLGNWSQVGANKLPAPLPFQQLD